MLISVSCRALKIGLGVGGGGCLNFGLPYNWSRDNWSPTTDPETTDPWQLIPRQLIPNNWSPTTDPQHLIPNNWSPTSDPNNWSPTIDPKKLSASVQGTLWSTLMRCGHSWNLNMCHLPKYSFEYHIFKMAEKTLVNTKETLTFIDII